MENNCLYEVICSDLKELIAEGKIQTGEKIPSLNQLCKDYKVSHITVLRAMKELVADNILEARKGKGYFVKRDMLSAREKVFTNIIACITRPSRETSLHDNYFNDINQAVQRECMARGFNTFYPKCNLILSPYQHGQKHDLKFFQEMLNSILELNSSVDGFILDERIPDELITSLKAKINKPLVVIGRKSNSDADAICPDNIGGARQAAELCLKMNYESFIVCINAMSSPNIKDRTNSFIKTLKKHNVDNSNITQIEYNIAPYETTFAQLEKSVTAQKTLIFSPTDGFARWLCDEFKKKGSNPGEDIGILGFEGMGYATMKEPHITTVDTQSTKIGQKAAEVLIGRINGTIFENPSNHIVKSVFKMGETI
jgi:DNA-binding LacI/PurR family transcriptional regulator